MNKFSEIFEKYFPKIATKNETCRYTMVMVKTMLMAMNEYVNNNINKDI